MKKVFLTISMVLLLIASATIVGAFSFPEGLQTSGLMSSVPSSMTSYFSNAQSPVSGYSPPASSLQTGGMTPATQSLLGSYTPVQSSTPQSGFMTSYPISTGGSLSMPASTSQSSPTAFSNSDWALNNMQFFSKPAPQPEAKGSFSQDEVMAIMDYISKMPSPDQMTPVTNDTITGTNNSQNTAEDVHAQFISVSPAVPSDSVIFIEVTDMTLPLSPGMSFQVPKVDMGYQYSDTKNSLMLRKKDGADVNTSNIVVGKFIEDDNTYTYSYNWDAGNAPDITLYGLEILFVGADGRVSISYDGKIIDMMPGQKYESNNKDSTDQKVFKIVNYGLVPRSGIQVVDKI